MDTGTSPVCCVPAGGDLAGRDSGGSSTSAAERDDGPADPSGEDRNEPEIIYTREEKRAALLGAMSAGLVIGLIYLAAGAAVIALMILLWERM